jgi:hypothetical protein
MTVQIHGLTYDSTTKHLAFVDQDNVYISKVFEPNLKEPPGPETNDPLLDDAIPLTKTGDHAFPIFRFV